MFSYAVKAVFLVVAVFATGTSLSARLKDFTKANNAFSSSYKSEKSRMSGEKNLRFDKEKIERVNFVSPDDASRLSSERAYFPDGLPGKGLSEERYRDNEKDFAVKEYTGKTGMWHDDRKAANIDNLDLDLSKDYSGRIDFDKRNPYQRDMDFIQERYGDMMEQSMQDINKYFFRGSRSSEPGLDIKTAGADIYGDDTGSFFDFLSRNKKIERPRVSIKGPVESKDIPIDRESLENMPQKPSSTSDVPTPYAKILPPSVNSNVQSPDSKSNKKSVKYHTMEEEQIDVDHANTFQFMRLPENMRAGKASIKVQVKEDDF